MTKNKEKIIVHTENNVENICDKLHLRKLKENSLSFVGPNTKIPQINRKADDDHIGIKYLSSWC